MPKELYSPTKREMKKAEGMMTEEQKFDSEDRAAQRKVLDAYLQAEKDRLAAFVKTGKDRADALVKAAKTNFVDFMRYRDHNRSADLVTGIAENLKTKDGLVYVAVDELSASPYGHDSSYSVFFEKPEFREGGGFDPEDSYRAPCVASAQTDIQEINHSLDRLKGSMDLVKEEDYPVPGPELSFLRRATLYIFKHKKKELVENS